MNSGPGDQFRKGFPDGFQECLHPRVFGKRLTVSFIDRIDQIHFELYAGADRGAGYHVDDLLALEPTDKEIETAVGYGDCREQWVIDPEAPLAFTATMARNDARLFDDGVSIGLT